MRGLVFFLCLAHCMPLRLFKGLVNKRKERQTNTPHACYRLLFQIVHRQRSTMSTSNPLSLFTRVERQRHGIYNIRLTTKSIGSQGCDPGIVLK